MARVLISGGAGFIGTHLTRELAAAGHDVRILDNLSPQVHGDTPEFEPIAGAEFIYGDVTSRADWSRALGGVDTIVHLAAETGTGQSMYEVDLYYRINVQGTAILFDVLANERHSVGNVVLASSRSVYGEGAYACKSCGDPPVRRFPPTRSKAQLEAGEFSPPCPECGGEVTAVATRESDPVAPASIYAATKLAQEELVRTAGRALGIPHAILRLQNVYGEGQSLMNPYTGILAIFSSRIRQGLSLPIFEDGGESRDFIHVEDVARVMRAFVESPSPAGETLNVGSGEAVSVLALARLLCRTMRSSIEPQVTGEFRIGDIRHNFADISALRTRGLVPQIGLADGIERFCAWAASQPIPENLLDKANADLKSRKLMA